jgi:hypothetical protein
MNKILVFIILLLLGLIFGMLYAIDLVTLNRINILSDSFNKLFIGIAAIVGSLGVLKVLTEYLTEQKRKRKIKYLREVYSVKKIGVDFDLLSRGKAIFIYNKLSNTAYHVGNYETFCDLLFGGYTNKIKTIGKTGFKKFNIGDTILTTE